MIQKIVFLLGILSLSLLRSQDLPPFELTPEWLSKVEALAPSYPEIPGEPKQHLLIFSLVTGYDHWVVPHTEAVMEMLACKTQLFEVTRSSDITEFEKDQLQKYDVILLNNNCSERDKRNLFWDALKSDKNLNDGQRMEKAARLEQNLLAFVREGGGLMGLHGAITMQNKSATFSDMMGGSFDYHPKQQRIKIEVTDPDHPLTAPFTEGGFEHVDEPYFFNNAYTELNFHPLLYMQADQLEGVQGEDVENIRYVAWIRPYGNGRVFYASPSHNAQSFMNPELLDFYMNGMKYVAGKLPCDDSPLKPQ